MGRRGRGHDRRGPGPAWSACPASPAWPAPPRSRTSAPTARRWRRSSPECASTTGKSKRSFLCRTSSAVSATVPASSGRLQPGRRYVVLGVTFRLDSDPLSAPVRYPELAAALGIGVGERVKCADVRSAVLELRRRKGMVIDPADPDTRSVGSFFVNPVLDAAALARIEAIARARCGEQSAQVRRRGRDGQGARGLADRAGRLRQGLRPGQRGADLRQAHARPGQLRLRHHVRADRAGQADQGRGARYLRRLLSPEPLLIGVTL